MSDVVFCHRITELENPAPESVTMACEICHALMWVHPNSLQIVLTEGARLVCSAHIDLLLADDAILATHPLQGEAIREAGRLLGIPTAEEARRRG